jgi:hypothetical protein
MRWTLDMEVEIEREGAHTNMEDADVPKLKRRGGAALHGLILVSNIFCSHGSQISPFGTKSLLCRDGCCDASTQIKGLIYTDDPLLDSTLDRCLDRSPAPRTYLGWCWPQAGT